MEPKEKKSISSWVKGKFEPKLKRNKAPKAKSDDIKTTSQSSVNVSVSVGVHNANMLESEVRADACSNTPADGRTEIGSPSTSVELADKVKGDLKLIQTTEADDAGHEGKYRSGIC